MNLAKAGKSEIFEKFAANATSANHEHASLRDPG